MLTELSDLQESEEEIWGMSKVSFTISTRSETGDEIIEREYTFSHAPEWDKWTFNEFEERRTNDTPNMTQRNWRRSRHIYWNDTESPTVEVPPEVTTQLEELLDVKSVTIQTP